MVAKECRAWIATIVEHMASHVSFTDQNRVTKMVHCLVFVEQAISIFLAKALSMRNGHRALKCISSERERSAVYMIVVDQWGKNKVIPN